MRQQEKLKSTEEQLRDLEESKNKAIQFIKKEQIKYSLENVI